LSDIFEEVEEEVRRDRMSALWQRYGILVWLLAGAIILAVGGREYLQHRENQRQSAQIRTFEDALGALDAGKFDTAEARLAEIADAGSPLSTLAAHYLASARLQGGGDRASAAAALDMAGAGADAPLERLARLKAAYLVADKSSLADLEARLSGLLEAETVAGTLARELVAAKAFERGDMTRARQAFNRLQFDAQATSALSQRARIALEAIPAPAGETRAPAPADTEDGAPPAPPAPDNTDPETQP